MQLYREKDTRNNKLTATITKPVSVFKHLEFFSTLTIKNNENSNVIFDLLRLAFGNLTKSSLTTGTPPRRLVPRCSSS